METRFAEPEQPFAGLPHGPVEELERGSVDVAILAAAHGTPYHPGAPSHAAWAPAALRRALTWYDTRREHLDMDHGGPLLGAARVVDLGDVAVAADDDGARNRAAIAAAVHAVREKGAVPVLLGGDDSVPIPFVEAFAGEDLWVVQVDAHLDWRHEVQGVTHGYSSTMRRASEMAHVRGIVQIGARGVGSARAGELDDAVAWGAQIFPMRVIHAEGLAPAIEAVPEGARILLTMDADGLDPGLCPGVLSPAFGGLSYQQMLDLFEGLTARGTVVGATMVEYVPVQDPQGLGAKALARLLCNLIARMFPAPVP